MKGVGNKCWNTFKLPFLRYSTGGSGMIVELFSHRPFIKILFCRSTIWISRFRITEHFPGNFREISANFFGNFSENSYIPLLPPSPTPHITYPHPTPETVNPLRTLNSLFSKAQFDCISTFISHTLHIENNIKWYHLL